MLTFSVSILSRFTEGQVLRGGPRTPLEDAGPAWGGRKSFRGGQTAQEEKIIITLPMSEPTGVSGTCFQLSLVLPAEGKVLDHQELLQVSALVIDKATTFSKVTLKQKDEENGIWEARKDHGSCK